MATVLLVEDGPTISGPLTCVFEREDYEVLTHDTDKGALKEISVADIIVLDPGLPDIDGLGVACQIRVQGLTIPILMLTARSGDSDLVVGLDVGADDYVTKPFRLAELLTRVRAQVRRVSGEATEGELSVGETRVDVATYRAFVGSRKLQLTARGSELLQALMHAGGKVASGEDILKEVWGEGLTGNPRALRMHMTWLRRKLDDDEKRPALLLARESGYLLTVD